MSKKHYESIAKHLNSMWVELAPGTSLDQTFMGMVDNLCYEFEAGNPNFDRARFLEAVTKED